MASNAAHYPPSAAGYATSSYDHFPSQAGSNGGGGGQFRTASPQHSFLHSGNNSRISVTSIPSSSSPISPNSSRRCSQGSTASSFGTPPSSGEKKTARFGGGGGKSSDYQEERSKILTMKYGKQQMMLIRKRLKVEMWLMDELEGLFEDENLACKCDMDIDNLLDLDSNEERRAEILKILSANNCSASTEDTQGFITQFLEKLGTL